MDRIVLHIGSAKCGSSSLQNFLSYNFASSQPRKNKEGQTVSYAAIAGDRLLVGDQLLQLTKRSPFNYCSSVPLCSIKKEILDERIHELGQFAENIDIVILSCEGWAQEYLHENALAFHKLGVHVDLILVTRPPVDLLSSGWWQWGAWTELSVEDWCKHELKLCRFFDALSGWKSLYPLAQIKLIELSQNPVEQVIKFLGFDPDDFVNPKRSNEATNADLLKHLIRNKSLYERHVHNSEVEFYLNRVLNLPVKKPPHVISLELAKHIVSECFDSSRQVLDLLADEVNLDKSILSRYLDGESYSTIEHVDYKEWILDGTTDEFIFQLIKRIYTLHESSS